MTFKTDDIEAAIEHVKGLGYELVDIDLESEDWKEAFLRPRGAHGTLDPDSPGRRTPTTRSRRAHAAANLEELLSA